MRNINIYVAVVCCLMITSCARIVTPSGGERDIKAPEYVGSYPQQNALNFKGDKIEIDFDEYIVLDNATGKLIVSPPLKNKPTVGSKLRTLYVKGLDSLQENTTYIFDFGDAVTDYTEGNRLSHFSFAFSTGNVIDTLFYNGRLLNAYTLKPEANKFVTLYRNKDRNYMRENLPDYITRTDSNGRFYFQNIKEGDYFLLAFEDMNQNMLYDLVTEGYGCKADISVSSRTIANMTTVKDSLQSQNKDTNPSEKTNKSTLITDTILYNTAEDTVQKIISSKIVNERELQIITSLPASDEFAVKFTKPSIDESQFAVYYSKLKDTITVIATSNATFDTLTAEITDMNGFSDKLDLTYFVRKKRNKDDNQSFYVSFSEKEVPYFQNIALTFPTAVNTQKYPRFEGIIVSSSDTNRIVFISDEHNPKRFYSDAKLKQGEHYTLRLDSAVVYTYDGKYNDTLSNDFHVTTEDDYGSLSMNIAFADTTDTLHSPNPHCTLILTLFDDKGNEIQTVNAHSDSLEGTLFDNLGEGKYRLRLIIDQNGNNKWDKGDFISEKEPEKVLFFNKTISVRKGWQTQEDWIVNA